jgi:hypothetical protein
MSEMTERMLERERIANRPKHWVRLTTACNSHCLFCLDMDTPRNVYLSEEDVKAEILRGRDGDERLEDHPLGRRGPALHPLFPEFVRYARRSRLRAGADGHQRHGGTQIATSTSSVCRRGLAGDHLQPARAHGRAPQPDDPAPGRV